MANREFVQFRYSLEKKIVDLYAVVTFGSSGAPTLDTKNSKGVLSVTRNSAGTYTFVFGARSSALDLYTKLLGIRHTFNTSGPAAAPASPSLYIKADSTQTAGTASVQVVFNAAGTATDPASGEIALIQFTFKDSTAP